MAKTVIWSHSVTSDLDSLAEFISKDFPVYASSFVTEALGAGFTLDKFSERGRVVPEFNLPSIREIFVRECRLIYRIAESGVEILAFIHGARDLKKLWMEEKRNI